MPNSVLAFDVTFRNGSVATWCDIQGQLRVIRVVHANGEVLDFPDLPPICYAIGQGFPVELSNVVLQEWADIRARDRGPWIWASHTILPGRHEDTGQLLSVTCPAIFCQMRLHPVDGRIPEHDSPTTFSECGWSGVRVLNDLT